jgi:anti-sigma regulatory factor (Ser/Thr protein kinase)
MILAPDNASPRLARLFVRDSIDGRLDPRILDDLLLLASEIVTNVVRHAGTDAELWLDVRDHSVVFACLDHDTTLPTRRQPGPTDENGRGLQLIESIASSWGVEPLPGKGKVVWVTMRRERRE